MIPIGLPSIEFVLTCLAFLLATVSWLGWTIALVLIKRLRLGLRGKWAFVYALLTAASVLSLWKVYDVNQRMSAYELEQRTLFHPTLTQTHTIAGIQMPAGTVLKLGVPLDYESFYEANFPHPIDIQGVQTTAMARYISYQTDENYKTAGYTPQNMRLTGIGTATQSGWLCDAAFAITLTTLANGNIRDFQSCTLANGNIVDGIHLPSGAEVIATTGTTYTDGRIDQDRWLIHLPSDTNTNIHQRIQRGGAIYLDGNRKLYRHVE